MAVLLSGHAQGAHSNFWLGGEHQQGKQSALQAHVGGEPCWRLCCTCQLAHQTLSTSRGCCCPCHLWRPQPEAQHYGTARSGTSLRQQRLLRWRSCLNQNRYNEKSKDIVQYTESKTNKYRKAAVIVSCRLTAGEVSPPLFLHKHSEHWRGGEWRGENHQSWRGDMVSSFSPSCYSWPATQYVYCYTWCHNPKLSETRKKQATIRPSTCQRWRTILAGLQVWSATRQSQD